MLLSLSLPNDLKGRSPDLQITIEQDPAPENVIKEALDILTRRPHLLAVLVSEEEYEMKQVTMKCPVVMSIALLLFAASAHAVESSPERDVDIGATAEETALTASAPESLLRQMSEELNNAGTYRFHAEINFDDVLISGQKLQYAGAADVRVRHPDGIFVDYRDDLSAKRFWYDGETGTLLDVFQDVYSTVDLPGDIDTAIDHLQDRYGLALPLGDLISSDVFAVMDDRALAWGYIGVHDVEGTPAHHIAIVGENADLQVWIQEEGRPVPLKIVVTYKNVPMAPQYQAVLMDWEFGADVAADSFERDLPEGVLEAEFLVVEGSE